jgi:hypothetical protein
MGSIEAQCQGSGQRYFGTSKVGGDLDFLKCIRH